ncbi:MAG: hypothetical protein ACP5J4_16825 [Anaerolineae bacterium]
MTQNQDWKLLYRIGAIAALVAAVLFRRNFGAEVSLFTGIEAIPQSTAEWYTLLQSDPFIGLSFLAVFDLFNYVLVGVLFLALGAAFWRMHKSMTVLALVGGLVGIAVNLASNISLSMLSLSRQYAVAASEPQKAALLTAGQALLATNNPLATFPGTGAYMSVLLIALAGLLFSLVMLRSNRATAIVGLLASACDLAYCLTVAFAPSMRALWLASGGLFWMIWHLLVARILFKCAKE